MKKITKHIYFVFLLLAFTLPAVSFASTLSFDTSSKEISKGQEFVMQVFLDLKGDLVNAIDGTVIFPQDLLDVKEIREGNSTVNFWIEHPTSIQETRQNTGSITFSGIVPNGFALQKNFLFSVVFRAKQNGTGKISATGLQFLKNDGTGSSAKATFEPLTILVSDQKDSLISSIPPIEDINPPESFKPSVGSDPTLFDGRYFLVFDTLDKESGLDHFEIREGYWGNYVVAQSPYELSDQSLTKTLYVKAVDVARNERVEILESVNKSWYQDYPILVIILLIALVGFLFKKYGQYVFHRKKRRSRKS